MRSSNYRRRERKGGGEGGSKEERLMNMKLIPEEKGRKEGREEGGRGNHTLSSSKM